MKKDPSRSEVLLIRLSPREKKELGRVAKRARRKPSAFARDILLPHLTPPPRPSASHT